MSDATPTNLIDNEIYSWNSVSYMRYEPKFIDDNN